MPTDEFKNLIAPIEDRMVRTISRLVRDPDDAADAMQEVLSTVWKKLETVRRHPNPQAYVMRICISKAYDVLRKRSRRCRREVSIEEVFNAGGVEPEILADERADSEKKELVEAILAAIAQLPPQQAQAVVLRIVNECSFREIAETLDCAEATAYSHYSKGKARLREIFSNKDSKKEMIL